MKRIFTVLLIASVVLFSVAAGGQQEGAPPDP